MFGRILVTLDGTPTSEQVLPQVEQLIADTDASATLLTVAELPKETVKAPPPIRQPLAKVWGQADPILGEPRLAETVAQASGRVQDELEHYLEEKGRSLRTQGITVDTVVRFGDPAEEIIAYARAHRVDLIMMATHGRTGLSQVIFGSVADRVLASGVAPVLLVRPDGLK